MSAGANPSVLFVVEDDPSVRVSLRRLFVLHGYAVEEFGTPLAFLSRLPIDTGCVVTDLRLPQMSGVAMLKEAVERGCLLPFVFITGHGEVPDAVEAMKMGAVDFLEKPLQPEQLLAAVKKAMSEGLRRHRLREEQASARRLLDALTPRERQVCEMVARGLLNKQVAAELGTSEKTVKTQRGSATRKLRVTSTAALVDLFRRAGQ